MLPISDSVSVSSSGRGASRAKAQSSSAQWTPRPSDGKPIVMARISLRLGLPTNL